MKNDAITPEQWAGTRKKWERDSAYSYGKAASELGVSKQMVGKVASREGWQKSISAALDSKKDAPQKSAENLHKSGIRHTRALLVDTKAPVKEASAEAQPRQPIDLGPVPQMPSGLSYTQQLAFIEKAVLDRQVALNQAQAREIRAIKAGVYSAIKDGSFESARSAKARMEALKGTHAMEMTNELERVRLELGAFSGVRQQACQIIVHQMPGCQIAGGDNSPEAMERRAVVADARMTVIEARRIVAAADAEIERKAGWDVIDVGGNNV